MMLGREGWDFMVRHQPVKGEDSNHVDLPRAREGGLDAAFFSIYMPGTITGPEAVKRSLILIDHVRSLAEKHPNEIVLATTAAEVRAAHKAGKFAALMGMEGGHMIDDSLAVLRDYQRLGVRYLTLSHSVNTNWSDSSGDTPKHNGLTDFGKDVVRELNRLGMLVDISHVSDKTFWDALETSKAPLVASHSSLRSISGHPRNMTDDMIRALGGKGGVIMINYSRSFLSDELYQAGLKNVPPAERPTRIVGEDRRAHRPRRQAGRRDARRPRFGFRRHHGARRHGRCVDAAEDHRGAPRQGLQRAGREEHPRREHPAAPRARRCDRKADQGRRGGIGRRGRISA